MSKNKKKKKRANGTSSKQNNPKKADTSQSSNRQTGSKQTSSKQTYTKQPEKKPPIYKLWYFWAIIFIIIAIFVLVLLFGGSSTESEVEDTNTTTQEETTDTTTEESEDETAEGTTEDETEEDTTIEQAIAEAETIYVTIGETLTLTGGEDASASVDLKDADGNATKTYYLYLIAEGTYEVTNNNELAMELQTTDGSITTNDDGSEEFSLIDDGTYVLTVGGSQTISFDGNTFIVLSSGYTLDLDLQE